MKINIESTLRSDELDLLAQENITQTKMIINYKLNESRKKKILNYLCSTETDWNNFNWQMKNRISKVNQLDDIFGLTKERFNEIVKVEKKYRWSISPYYLSLIDVNDINDPIGLMAIPSLLELNNQGEIDPMDEEHTNPASLITRRYPDRLMLNITNSCGVFCRFCQRKRNIGEIDYIKKDSFFDAINFIMENKYIRDVLITGGDPLTLTNDYLEMILNRLRQIKHVEIIRIGTRIPATIPQRINKKLLRIFKKYHPLYINLHFNHPKELTEEAKEACAKLADSGIPLGNQMVLLNNINNNKYLVMNLNKELLKVRVKPYYIFFSKNVKGTIHFNCNVNEGIEIMDFLRGNVSGLAIPNFVINAPKGLGKVQILRKYYEINNEEVELTTWENRKICFMNPKNQTMII